MGTDRRNWSTATLIALLALAGAPALVACGSGDEGELGPLAEPPDYGPALERAPPELAELYEPGGVLLDGGLEGLEAELDRLRGFPVVVNKWASWCAPCRQELPFLQSQAAARLDEIAFIGLNTDDGRDAAETFLRDFPVPYPSFFDPEGELARAIDADLGFPNTVLIDREGEIAHVHRGVYATEEELAAQIDEHALEAGGSDWG